MKSKSIVELFSERAKQLPDQIAIVMDERSLTYRQLDQNSNQLARYLQRKGVSNGTLVTLCMDRSLNLITSILGIVKAGGVYVPIDPDYPPQRIKYILEDTHTDFVISDSSNKFIFADLQKLEVIYLEEDLDRIKEELFSALTTKIEPDDLAYAIYTSGSSGHPKGVLIKHSALNNLIDWHVNAFEVDQQSRASVMAGVGFDASVWEIWPYLCQGATLLIVPTELRLSPNDLFGFYNENRVSHSFMPTVLVPDFVKVAKNKALSLAFLLTGGDSLPPIDIQDLDFTLVNNYGPTENTVVATYCCLTAVDKDKKPSIGKPISNVQIYIVAENGTLAPAGSPGELLIGGKSLAHGYLNRPELNKEKFIVNPFDETGNTKLYKTGDLARWLPNEQLEFLGRIDDQVKIRGFRLELGEIEKVILQFPLIDSCVVVARGDESTNKYLLAYFTSDESIDLKQLDDFIKTELPHYMIPRAMVQLPSFPMNSNGKIDKKRLPHPDFNNLDDDELLATQSPEEEKMLSIWQSVLGIEKIGANSNFFNLGGHSLIAVKLIGRVNDIFATHFPISILLEFPSIRSLCDHIATANEAKETKVLMALQSSEENPPIYLVPGAGGNIMSFYQLSEHLGKNQAFYAFQAHGLDGKSAPLKSVRQMATAYIKEMQKIQASGPYRIGGYSFGGTVAYEMAMQLEESGFEVEKLIILDAKTPGSDIKNAFKRRDTFEEHLCTVAEILAEFYEVEIDLPDWIFQNKSKLQQFEILHEELTKVGIEMTIEQVRSFAAVYITNISSLYDPPENQSLDAPIAIFKTQETTEEVKNTDANFREDLGWKEFTHSTVDVYAVPGTHLTFLNPPHVEKLANYLSLYLQDFAEEKLSIDDDF